MSLLMRACATFDNYVCGQCTYLMIDISRISRRTWEKLRSVILPCTARQQWH